ncbi:hypothetical protein ACE6H2_007859 [Prunus campanulata]
MLACRRTNPSFVCIPYFEPCHQGMWDGTVNFNVCSGGCLVYGFEYMVVIFVFGSLFLHNVE